MISTLPPRFLDVHQAATPTSSANFGTATWNASSTLMSDTAPVTRHDTQYTLWNYVAIKRIADRISEMTPHIGFTTDQPNPTRKQISHAQQTWVQQHYGARWLQSHQEWQELPTTHPMVKLLSTVNNEQTFAEFIQETVIELSLHGSFYWWVIANGLGTPLELHVLPKSWVLPDRRQSDGTLRGYLLTVPGMAKPLVLTVDEVIKGRAPNPRSKTEGWSGLDAGEKWIASAEALETSRSASYKNGINPSALVSLSGEQWGNPSDDVLNRIKARIMARASGTERAGEPVLAPPGVTITPWGTSPKELDFQSSMSDVRDVNLALHGTPPIVAGISRDYNRATADAAALMWAEVCLNPTARMIAGVMTEKLAPRFDERIRVWYDDFRPANHEHRLAQFKAASEAGAVSPDEWRSELALPERGTPAYQTGYLPVARQPIDAAMTDPHALDLPQEPDNAETAAE